MKSFTFIILCGLLFAFSCQAPQTEPPTLSDSDKAAIDSTIEAGQTAWNESGAEAFVNAFYANDVVFMPPNHAAIQGKAGLIDYLNEFPDANVVFNSVAKGGSNEIAFNHGTYTMSMTDDSGNMIEIDRGKFIEIWEKQDDGSWKISKDIYNSDMPVPDDEDEEMDDDEMDE